MPQPAYIKLSDLTRQVSEVIKSSFNDYYWIVAEISGHKFYPNTDRHYFDFIEKLEGQSVETAKARGAAWAAGSESISRFQETTGQQFSNGMQVLVRVRVEFHPIHGFSLVLVDIDPSFTLGNLERQRRETLARLVELNPDAITKVGDTYHTRNQQLPLPAVIQRIALVASPNSEGYNDFLHTMQANRFGYKFLIDEYRSSVQGANAEKELVDTLVNIYNSGTRYDAVVIVRGGGAKTDFVVFDTYPISRAVARFPVPVITGIGHHKDVSIVDLMAHTATKTPTQAAELIIAHARAFEELVLKHQQNLVIRAQQTVAASQQAIARLHTRLTGQARQLLATHRENLLGQRQLVSGAGKLRLAGWGAALAALQQQLGNHSRSTLQGKATALLSINQSVIRKSSRLLHEHSTTLTGIGHSLKTHTRSVLHRSGNALEDIRRRLDTQSRSLLHRRQTAFGNLATKLTARPMLLTATAQAGLSHLSSSIQLSAERYISFKKRNLEHQKALMKALSPDTILKKGFALVSRNGRVLKDASGIDVGAQLTVTLNDTELHTTVISKVPKDGNQR